MNGCGCGGGWRWAGARGREAGRHATAASVQGQGQPLTALFSDHMCRTRPLRPHLTIISGALPPEQNSWCSH